MTRRIALAAFLLFASGCAGAPGAASGGVNDEPAATETRTEPRPFVLARAFDSARFFEHACVVEGGAVYCWGRNETGAVTGRGGPPEASPVPVAGLDRAVQVSTGYDHSCAVLESGRVACWGGNELGQLGDGSNAERQGVILVEGIDDAVRVSAGAYATCALRPGGVVCWGDACCAGEGETCRDAHRAPHGVEGLTDAVDVHVIGCSHGDEHGPSHVNRRCALTRGGHVACITGDRAEVRDGVERAVGLALTCSETRVLLDDGRVLGSNETEIEELRGATRIAGDCGIVDGRVRCHARDAAGQRTWEEVEGLTDATELLVGRHCRCARRETGDLVCWGADRSGSCGVGGRTWFDSPRRIDGLDDVAQVAVGNSVTCTRSRSGEVRCLGRTVDGVTGPWRRGDPTHTTTPTQIDGIGEAVDITVGDRHACAVRRGGEVLCWGSGPNRRLRDDGTPVVMTTLRRALRVESAWGQTCAAGYGGVRCIGHDPSAVERVLGAGPAPTDLVVGRSFGCRLDRAGQMKCWGAHSVTPRRFTEIDAAQYRLCGIQPRVGIACLTYPYTTSAPRLQWVELLRLPDATRLALSQRNSGCALRRGGRITCWGDPRGGRAAGRTTATDIDGIPDPVTDLVASALHTCALTDGGEVWCWGSNGSGQLGVTPEVAEPTVVELPPP